MRAIDDLKTAGPYELGEAPELFIYYLYPAYVRGNAYLLAHEGERAAAEFQKLVNHRDVVINFVTGALAHLQIGRAYAPAGAKLKAKAAYETSSACGRTPTLTFQSWSRPKWSTRGSAPEPLLKPTWRLPLVSTAGSAPSQEPADINHLEPVLDPAAPWKMGMKASLSAWPRSSGRGCP
jgi:hypothetical protein